MRSGAPETGKRRAFTLMEVLIAMAILAFIITAIYSCWSAILRGSRAGLVAAKEAQRSRIAMNSIVDALACSQMFGANPEYYSFVVDTNSDFTGLSFVARLPKSYIGSGLFGEITLRRVTFSVEPGPNGGNQLLLWQQPVLIETNVNEQLGPTILGDDISLFAVDFWDIRKREWMVGWLQTNQLPPFVRVSIGHGNVGRGRRAVPAEVETRMVFLPSIVIPRGYQLSMQPGAGPPGAVPPGAMPPGAVPPGTVSPGVIPPGPMPPVRPVQPGIQPSPGFRGWNPAGR